MSLNATNPNLYGMGREALAEALAPLTGEAFRARQVFRALYRRDSLSPDDWTDQPRDLRSAVAASFRIERPRIASSVAAADGTRKFLLELPEGGRVESVVIPAADRMTFCISSQVGCGFGCEFCMTARMGFVRNLAAGEIVGQVAAMIGETRVAPGRFNIVFMGMGEPLHNLDSVMTALDLLFDEDGFGLGPRRVTVSTVGLPKGILRLASRATAPRLAVSLVSADQQRRERLMPAARSVRLDDLVQAVREFGEGRRDKPTLEVVLLRDQNDGESDAKLLADLSLQAGAKVNLIEFNPTPQLPFRPTTEQRLQRFLAVLSAYGVTATVRRSRGKDVEAACGQLAIRQHAQDAS